MRKVTSILTLILLSALLAVGASERKKEDPAAFAKIVELVESNQFYIRVTDAFPTGNSSITIRTKYGTNTLGGEGYISLFGNEGTLTMMDSIATGKFPFFGRGYNLPYGGGGGIEFDKANVTHKKGKIVKKRKQEYLIYKFSVPTQGDVFDFTIEIFSNDNCTVNISSNNRASISYGGKISAIPEKEREESIE